MPEDTLEAVRQSKIALKGPCTTPVGVSTRYDNVDLVVLAAGRKTRDLAGVLGTLEFADAVIDYLAARAYS